VDHDQLVKNAVDQTMSRLTPPMNYFTEFVDKQDHYDRFKLMNCVNYHQAVAHFFPFQKAEAYGMLGFCYERLGQDPQAVASYQQAIALNPDYFWPYYNLGVIFYRQAQYSKAGDYLTQGLKLDPIKTIVLLSRSKVYNDVNLSGQRAVSDYFQGLQEGRREAYLLMMDSLLHQQSGSTMEQHLKPRVRFF
jgi:tetratricopeptide (TPR) repeat protein